MVRTGGQDSGLLLLGETLFKVVQTVVEPFELLGDALDELVAAGGLAPERRLGADLLAWSAVHGLATLLLTGPLRRLDAGTVAALDQRLLDMVERGLPG